MWCGIKSAGRKERRHKKIICKMSSNYEIFVPTSVSSFSQKQELLRTHRYYML